MQELIPINLTIGDRNYRVRIEPRDEEKVRQLIRRINDQLLDFKTRFAGKDMQDYIAMVLLWFVTEQQEGQMSPEMGQLPDRLNSLESLLDEHFKG
jgi:cell division protein ZapA (FtsZ GTPase activity inhibitor)